MRIAKFIISLFFAASLFAQTSDTLSVYFEFGKHEISPKQLKRIQLIPQNVYVNDLDSVHYIGMADSVGSVKANKKLGERRAKEVAKYSKKYFTTDPNIKIMSKGELRSANTARSRRVDVIFYQAKLEEEEKPELITDTLCLKRTDSLFHRSLVRDIEYRGEEYVVIETILNRKELKKYYYLNRVRGRNSEDTFTIHKVIWQRSRTKSSIDKSPDYFTKIPKLSFTEFSIFTRSNPPCYLPKLEKQQYIEQGGGVRSKCLQVDRFLMHHLQVKKILYNQNEVNVRVPKAYVNLEEVYTFYKSGDTITWSNSPYTTNVKGKKRFVFFKKWRETRLKKREAKEGAEKYYYTTVSVNTNYVLDNIMRMMDCAPSYSEPSEGSEPFCSTQGRCLVAGGGNGSAFLEVGSHAVLNEQRSYLALGYLTETDYSRWQISLGLSDSTSFYGSLGYDYRLLTLPVNRPKDYSMWAEPHELKVPKTFFSLYAGSRLSTFEVSGSDWTVNQNLHAGASLQRRVLGIDMDLFGEGGVGINYNLLNRNIAIPQVQFGLRFFLISGSRGQSQVGSSGRFL